MPGHDLRHLLARELRSALRERSIVVNSLLVPLFVYPVLLWLMFSVMTFVSGQAETQGSRLVFDGTAIDLTGEHAALLEALDEDETIERERDRDELGEGAEALDAAVRAGKVDLVVRLVPATGAAAALDGNFAVETVYDASKNRSVRALERFEKLLDAHRSDWLDARGLDLGLAPRALEIASVRSRDLASDRERGAFLFGMMVPMLSILMIAVGAFYPAVDAIAGERERGTWETTLLLPVARSTLLTAKWLYVAIFGAAAGLINMLAFAISMRAVVAPLLGDGGGLSFRIPWLAWPAILVSTVLFALLVAAGMILLASFARTFKEGQAMVTPFYLLVMLPAMLVGQPDVVLTARWALVPVANVVLLLRGVLLGTATWGLGLMVLASTVVVIGLLLFAARWVMSFEDVMGGDYKGSFGTLLRERLLGGRAVPEEPEHRDGRGDRA